MARHAKPWWRESHQAYYATVHGIQHRLGTTKKQADDELKRLLKEGPREVGDRTLLAVLLDDFLDFVKENNAPKTYRGYRDFGESFLRQFPKLKIDELSPDHVTEWLKDKPWNSTTKHGAITCLQTALNWARTNKGLKVNVLDRMKKPTVKTRTRVITDGQFKALLAEVPDPEFRSLLIFSFDCGLRPQEAKQLSAAHFDLRKKRAVLPAEEAKGKKHPRAIYVPTVRSLKLVRQAIQEFPDGPIFRNRNGKPWTASAVKCRFEKVQIALGRAEMKRMEITSAVTEEAIEELAEKLRKTKKTRSGLVVAKKPWELRHEAKLKLIAQEAKPYGLRFRHYDFRHTFITRKLIAGVDSHVVAAVSGHGDSAMIDRVYSHVADDHRFMLQAAKQGG